MKDLKKNNKEIWRWAHGYHGFYKVSSYGRVLSYYNNRHGTSTTPKLMIPNKGGRGYPTVRLSINKKGKTIPIYKIVAQAFIGKRPKGLEAAHLDGNRNNSRADNLSYVTPKINQSHKLIHGTSMRGEKHPMSKLKTTDILEIRRKINGRNCSEIAREYGINRSTVIQIKNGQRWGWLK